jgi:hypothetical protein
MQGTLPTLRRTGRAQRHHRGLRRLCVGARAPGGTKFASTTKGFLALTGWLAGHACTHVAIEATGMYWKPVWHVL